MDVASIEARAGAGFELNTNEVPDNANLAFFRHVGVSSVMS